MMNNVDDDDDDVLKLESLDYCVVCRNVTDSDWQRELAVKTISTLSRADAR